MVRKIKNPFLRKREIIFNTIRISQPLPLKVQRKDEEHTIFRRHGIQRHWNHAARQGILPRFRNVNPPHSGILLSFELIMISYTVTFLIPAFIDLCDDPGGEGAIFANATFTYVLADIDVYEESRQEGEEKGQPQSRLRLRIRLFIWMGFIYLLIFPLTSTMPSLGSSVK